VGDSQDDDDRTASLKEEFEGLRREFEPNMRSFLTTELELGNAFAKSARSGGEGEKSRNRKNARKAYDSVLHFLEKTTLTQEAKAEINDELAALKSDLQSLGETF
jgi:hypothetical protein